MNCTRPTGDTSRGSTNEEKSSDSSQPFCNDSDDAKRKRKGKQPVSADKIAKAATSAMTSPAAKLQPIGIIIPQTLDEPKEEGILGIPNMDSPLFKDVPRKRVESSSDSSSSSTSGDNSSDDSTSSEESDIVEEENNETKISNTDTKIDTIEEQLKSRIPIKLTISNLDKHPLKAFSSSKNISGNDTSSERDTHNSNSETDTHNTNSETDTHNTNSETDTQSRNSDTDIHNRNSETITYNRNSETDTHNRNFELDTNRNSERTAALQGDYVDAKNIPQESNMNSYHHCVLSKVTTFSKQVKNTGIIQLDNGHLSNNSQGNNHDRCIVAPDMTSKDSDLFYNSPCKQSDNSKWNSQMVNSFDQTSKESDDCRVNESAGSSNSVGVISFKQKLQPLSIYQEEEELEHLQQKNKFFSKNTGNLVKSLPVSLKILPGSVRSLKASSGFSPVTEGPLLITSELELAKEQLAKEDDSSLSEDSFITNNCQDGSILPSTLTTSGQRNLKATCKFTSDDFTSVQKIENTENAIVESKSSLEEIRVCKTKVGNSADSNSTQKTCNSSNITFQDDCKKNLSKDITSPHRCEKQNTALEKQNTTLENENTTLENENTDKFLLVEKIYASEIRDEKLDMNDINFSDKNSDKYLSTKTDKELLQAFDKKGTIPNKSSCSKDASVSTQSAVGNVSTETSSLTTSTAERSSINSTSRNNPATCGSTCGIPDSKNPFITWTKYDDDDDDSSLNVSGALPGSLVRVPFPHLPLPGDSPIACISPLGVAVSLMSPVGLAAASSSNAQLIRPSPGIQLTQDISTGCQGLSSSPNNNTAKQQTSLPDLQMTSTRSSSSSQVTYGAAQKDKTSHKSGKRTSRLSNIIDSLRTSKEKQAADSSPISSEHKKKRATEILFGPGRHSPSYESLSAARHRPSSSSSSSSSSSPVFSNSLSSDYRSSSEKFYHGDLGYPHQITLDPRHLMRSSMDAARVQTDHSSFGLPKNDADKGKTLLENLEMMNNGLLDAHGKKGPSDSKSQKLDNLHSHGHSRLPSSATTSASSGQTLASRPSPHLSSKSSNQAYTSAASSSIRTSSAVTTSSSSLNCGANPGSNSNMFHVAPLAATHVDLNTANMLTYQHLYGMQDPYLMKTLISNPVYLQRMMEFQKHAMDPMMLQQLEMYEILAAIEANKNNTDQATMNAQSILWQAHAASILQHQHMQQFQQLQLQQQQLQQQAAAARERKTRETIAAIMANKSSSFSAHTNKSIGSISTGQSAKSLMASTSSSTPSPSQTAHKRTRPPSSADIYSKEVPGHEKRQRHSQTFSHLPNQTTSTSSSITTSSASRKHSQTTTRPTSSSNLKTQSSTATYTQPKQDLLGLSAAFQVPQTSSPHLWGFPTFLQPSSLDMNQMSHFFERPGESSLSSLQLASRDSEPNGADALDLSVKPGGDKT